MFAPFPEDLAKKYCLQTTGLLDSGFLCMKQIASASRERLSANVMIGVLVCKNKKGEQVVLRTVSGSARIITKVKGFKDNAIFVKPIVSPGKITRVLHKNNREIHRLTDIINVCQDKDEKARLKGKRQKLTDESLARVLKLYKFHCADGKVKKLVDICNIKNGGALPPTGTGDCCAPKLLDYAYRHKLLPVSMAEIFYKANPYNRTPGSIAKVAGQFYPPCTERCDIILPHIIGLNILYRDPYICVVNKQSNLLSVPGRGPDKQDCLTNRLKRLFPDCIEQPSAHRLDMETSGILVMCFTKEAHRHLSMQFQKGYVHKTYTAILDGITIQKGIPQTGTMTLYHRLDVDHRPWQIWDDVNGKEAVTEWKILGFEKGRTRVLYIPHTGRTHQLRVASADSHGFGIPIVGDTLYGTCKPGERLLLHATTIEFTHPITHEKMFFECPPEF